MPDQSSIDDETSQSARRIDVYVAVSLIGFLLIALGLAVDFVLHANDPGLAAEEGIFTLQNPGHLLLGVGLITTAIGLSRVASIMSKAAGSDAGILRTGQIALGVGIVVLVGSAVYIAAGPGFGHDHSGDHSEAIDADILLSDGSDRSRLPYDEAVALASLVWTRPGSLDQDMAHSHHQMEADMAEPSADETESLADMLTVAAEAAPRFNTIEEATAAGYVQTSGVSDGSGSHWTKWSQIEQPFDPENPAQLLFDELVRGEDPELIAFSYWVASATAPEGFPGDTDHWHTHLGMCFENGWLKDDNIPDRRSCNGDWVNGSDLWMLHAWIVPGLENDYGVFHNVNPLLCERACGLEN